MGVENGRCHDEVEKRDDAVPVEAKGDDADREKRANAKYEDGSDRTLYVVVELDKVRERYTANEVKLSEDESLAWLYLLAGGYRDDRGMDAMMEQFETIKEFAERYRLAMGDPDLMRAYERYCEARTEYNDQLLEGQRWARKQGLDEGRKEGRKQGRKEGLAEAIDRLVRGLGMTNDEAMDLLGIPIEERPKYLKLL